MKQDVPQIGDKSVRNAHLVGRRTGERTQELDNLLHLQSAHTHKEGGDKVFGVILEAVSVEHGDGIDDEVNVGRDTSGLTGQVFDDAGLDGFRGDIGVVASIAIARRKRTERVVHKLRNLLQQRLIGHPWGEMVSSPL